MLLLNAVAIVVLAASSASAFASPFTGIYEISQTMTFHVVNASGGPFAVDLRVRDLRQAQMDRPILVRVFDPDERLMLRHDWPGEKMQSEPPWHEIHLDVPVRQPGVYQVTINGFGGWLEFATSPSLPFGVYAAPQLIASNDMLAQAYVFLPPGLDRLPIGHDGAVRSLVLEDERGTPQLTLDASRSRGEAALPTQLHQVWRMSVKGQGRFALDFQGLPVILCPDVQTARAIRASVDVLDDGTVCFHRFQVRAHALLEQYRRMNPAAFRVDPPVLSRSRAAWLADPLRHSLLLGPWGVYSALPVILCEQNLDPASPWFGTIHVWREGRSGAGVGAGGGVGGGVRRDNPFASYTRLGLSRVSAPVESLAAVWTIDEPFNSLRGNEALLNRVIVGALQDLMMLREHETLENVLIQYYGGTRAFGFAGVTQAFPLVIQSCPPDVRNVWTEGLRRFVDMQSIGQVAGTVNQWTFIPMGIQDFYDGTGETWYRDIVARHVKWMLTSNQWGLGHPTAGYFSESEGPDATYLGITLHSLAWLWWRTQDDALGQAIRQSLELFNHTIAPEPPAPNGRWIGANSFAHRTPGDWTTPQWGAGLGMLSGRWPEAAAHIGRTWPVDRDVRQVEGRRQAEQSVTSSLAYLGVDAFDNPSIGPTTIKSTAELRFRAWQMQGSQALTGQLPIIASDRFTRAFGDEFFCVRRPSYYAFLYAGRPMDSWQKSRRATDPLKQYPRNGGGLCMFWSPEFGTSLLGKNWSVEAAQSLIAKRTDGTTDWEEYWSVSSRFDVERARAMITGSIGALPMKFSRSIRFLDERVVMEVQLETTAALDLQSMAESFPFPLDKPGNLRVTLVDDQGRPMADGPARGIVFHNEASQVHLVVFDQPRSCTVGTVKSIDEYGQPREHGRVLAALPTHWKPGTVHRARWCMAPVSANGIPQAIQDAVRAMSK